MVNSTPVLHDNALMLMHRDLALVYLRCNAMTALVNS